MPRNVILRPVFLVGLICMSSMGQGLSAQEQSAVRDQDYLRDVTALSEVLGKAHAVRVRCNGTGDQYWRDHMRNLLDVEAAETGSLRQSLVAGFNQGFTFARARYVECDQDAVDSEARLAAQGKQLTDRLLTNNLVPRLKPVAGGGNDNQR